MIIDTGAVTRLPWPNDMPDGWAMVNSPASIATRAAIILAWRAMPAEFRAMGMVFQGNANAIIRTGDLADILLAYPGFPVVNGAYAQGVYSGGIHGGTIMQTAGTNGNVFTHEWGHVVDFNWRIAYQGQAAGSYGLSANAINPGFTTLYATIQPGLSTGVYGKTNLTEWWAEFFDGYARRDMAKMSYDCEARDANGGYAINGSLTQQAWALFNGVIPFAGNSLTQPYSTVIQSSNAPLIQNGGAPWYISADVWGNPIPTSVRWQKSLDSGATWIDAGLSTAATQAISVTDTNGTNLTYRALATNTVVTDKQVMTYYCQVGSPGDATPNPYLWPGPVMTAGIGTTLTLTAGASLNPGLGLTVKWQKQVNGSGAWTDIAGATANTYSYAVVSTSNVDHYRVMFTNTYGTVTSVVPGDGTGTAVTVITLPYAGYSFGFEDATNGGWAIPASQPIYSQGISSSLAQVHTGANSLVISMSGSTTNGAESGVHKTLTGLTIGTSYSLTVWGLCPYNDAAVRLGVTGISTGSWTNLLSSYQKYTYNFIASATSHEMLIDVQNGDSGTSIWIDDIGLAQIADIPSTPYSYGFEPAGLYVLDSWLVSSASISAGFFAARRTAGAHHTGVAAMSCSNGSGTTDATASGPARTFTGLTIGNVYTFTAWVLGDGNTQTIAIGVTGIGKSAFADISSYTVWVQISYTFTATAKSHVLAFYNSSANGGNGSAFFMDDITVA